LMGPLDFINMISEWMVRGGMDILESLLCVFLGRAFDDTSQVHGRIRVVTT